MANIGDPLGVREREIWERQALAAEQSDKEARARKRAAELADLKSRLDMLRSCGVSKFVGNGTDLLSCHVEFFPPSPAPLDPIVQTKADRLPAAEGEKPCKCSHGLEAHGPDGLCLLGCDAEKCGVDEEEP